MKKIVKEDLKSFVKNHFDKVYEEGVKLSPKEKYSRAFWYKPIQKEAMKKIGDIRNKKILMVGVGVGHEIEQFIGKNNIIIATDISFPALKISQNFRHNSSGTYNAVVDAEYMPFQSESFDIVYIQCMLMHVDIHKVSGEVFRILKKQGKLIIIDELNKNPFGALYRKFFKHKVATPYEYFMGEEDFIYIGKDYSNIICEGEYYIISLIPYILRIIWLPFKSKEKLSIINNYIVKGLESISQLFLKGEKQLIRLIPILKKYAAVKLIIYQK